MERKQFQLFFFFPLPFFPSCDLNPAGEGENSHVRHVGGAQLCKLHAREVFGMDPLARFVFHGRTQREATFSTLTAATCCFRGTLRLENHTVLWPLISREV